MSRVVDNRVVEMQFENANFERNVTQSMSTLDKLKAALSFKGVDNNFAEVERSTSSLAKSFDVFETMATGVFFRLGQKAADWATKTIKAMSGVENIQAGFQKFGDITKATGTLIAQGFSSDEVEEQLARLNWFTDETSYNLSDMVDNISKFTAAGQGLPESADAMMGIALWAALSGQNARTASRAMYQLAQAMGTYMKRQDWMSIQNANMDTVEFRQKALDAAVAIGTLEKNSEGLYRTLAEGAKGVEWFSRDQFVEQLTDGAWFTKDVMMKVFREYSAGVDKIYAYTEEHGVTASEAIEALGDQIDSFALKAFKAGQEARTWEDVVESVKDAASTGWMALFKKIFGNYEQATKLYTALANRFYDIFVEPINQLNDAFLKWANKGGRSVFIDSLLTMLGVAENVIYGIQDAYHQFFYDTDEMDDVTTQQGDSLLRATYSFKNFAYSLFNATKNLDSFTSVLNGIFGIFSLVKQAASAAVDTIFSLFGGLDPITDILESAAAGIGDFIGNLSKSAQESNFFGRLFESAFKPLFNIKAVILEFVEKITPKFEKVWEDLAPQFEKLKPGLDAVKTSLKGFFGLFKGYWERMFTNIDVDGLIGRLGKIWGKLRKVLFTPDENGLNVFDKINNFLLNFSTKIDAATDWVRTHLDKFWADASREVNKFIDWLIDNAGPAWSALKQGFSDTIEWLKTHMGPAWENVKKWFSEGYEWLKTNVPGAWETVKGWFTVAYDWINEHTAEIKQWFLDAWAVAKEAFTAIWGFLKSIFSGDAAEEGDLGTGEASTKLQGFLDALKKIIDVISTVFTGLWKLISPILDGIKNSFENMTFEGLGSAAAGGGLAVIGVALAKFINNLKKSNILEGLNELLGGIGDVLDSFAHSLDAKALKDAAIGVAILVGAIFVLTTIPIDTLTTTATALALFVKVFVSVVKSISDSTTGLKIDKKGLDFSSSNSGSTFFKMALGLVAIAVALKIIASIPMDKLYTAAVVVGVLAYVIGKILQGLATIKSGDKEITKNIFGGNKTTSIANFDGLKLSSIIFAIGTTLFLLALTIGKMTDIIERNLGGFCISVITIVGLMITMLAVIKNLDKAEISGKLFFAWIGLAGAIWILAKAIEPLSRIGWTSLLKAVTAVIMLLAAMGGLSVIIDKWGASGKKMLAFSASMLLLVGVIYALVGAVAVLTLIMQNEKAGDAFVVLGLLVVALAFLASQATKFNKGGDMAMFAAGLIVLSVALGLMAGVLYGLAEVAKGGHLLEAGLALAGILAALVGLAALIGKFKSIEKGFNILIAFGLSVAAIMAAAAASIWLIADAIKIFSDNSIDFDKAAENMVTAVHKIMDGIPQLIQNILEIAIGILVSKIALLSTTVLDSLLAVLDSLLEDDKLQRIIADILRIVNIILDNLLENIEPIVSKLVQIAGKAIVTACTELGKWASENREAISKALDDLIKGLFGIVLDLFDPLGKKIFGSLWDNEQGTGIKNFLETNAKDFLLITVIGFMAKTFVPKFLATLAPIETGVATLITKISSMIGLLKSAAPVLAPLLGATALVAAFGALDNHEDWQPEDNREKMLQDYYSSKNGQAEIRAKEGWGDVPVPPELQYEYAHDAYLKGKFYDPGSGTLKQGEAPSLGAWTPYTVSNMLDSLRKLADETANSVTSTKEVEKPGTSVSVTQYNSFQGNSTPTAIYRANNSMVSKVTRALNN